MAQEMTYNGVRISLVADYLELSRFAADIILKRIDSESKFNLLVPTGTTPLGVYGILRKQDTARFGHVAFFNMDEYCIKLGDQMELIPESQPASYKRYMKENLLDSITPAASYFPGVENVRQPGHYDGIIKRLGGIDLCLNAMGEDGHTFGFNFPGTPRDVKTRCVKITDQTKSVNERLTELKTPEYAITIGLMTGMESKEILFLVSGERKADILRRIIYAPEITQDIPATILREHSRCHWIVDEKAAGYLPQR